jgi:hypothetical protein
MVLRSYRPRRILYPPVWRLLLKGDDLKTDFEKNLAILKQLEELAKMTGNELDKFAAASMRTNMMSYKRMTRQVLVVACGKSPQFRKHVLEVMNRKDVEEMHRLWVKYCGGK